MVSRTTFRVAMPTPAGVRRATAVSMFLPSRSGTFMATKVPPCTVAGTPLTSTVCAWLDTVPDTWTVAVRVSAPSAGLVIWTSSTAVRVRSKRRPAAVALPARSWIAAETSRVPAARGSGMQVACAGVTWQPETSTPSTWTLRRAVSMPDRTSENCVPMAGDASPKITGAPGAVMLRFGGALSRLTVRAAEAALPALSTTDPPACWPAPSVWRSIGGVTVSMPESASEATKDTRTSWLFQPLAFAAGTPTARTSGGVVSMFSVTLTVALLPFRSVAVPLTTWFAPSAVTSTGPGQVAIPTPASAQVKLTWTAVLFQPLAFAGGVALTVIVGGTRSSPPVTI
ncbi:MAG: hypothetical protein DMF51_05900 [Acidobacteria bacterium]|nr:MAG: hypothetical protein DMF51_05900 [Acidobacteriota bacterium]